MQGEIFISILIGCILGGIISVIIVPPIFDWFDDKLWQLRCYIKDRQK